MDPVVEKTIETKLAKKEPLTKEEETAILKDQEPFKGNKSSTVLPEKEQVEEPAEEKTPEEIKSEEDAAAKKKAEEEAAAKPAEETDSKIDMVKLEEQLAKPDGQEDLKDLSKREIAYFWQMRRDRRARQIAEEEKDAALFREKQRQLKEKEEKPAEEAADPLAELKKKDPTDFLTIQEVVKIFEDLKKQPIQKEEQPAQVRIPPVLVKHLQFCEKEARESHPEDFDSVMELTNEIINTNRDYLLQVRDALQRGDNPAELSYQLIKKDPEFAKLLPAAEIRAKAKAKKPEKKEKTPEEIEAEKAEVEAKAKEKALEENQNKKKTTGHVAGGLEKPAEQYTMEEIARMTDKQFRQLPKHLRQKYLETYG